MAADIATHDPIGSSEQGIDVSGTQQRPLHAVPHGLPSETSRRGTRGGTRGGTSADIKKIDLDFKIRAEVATCWLILSGEEHVETIRVVLAAREVPAPGVMTRQLYNVHMVEFNERGVESST